MTSPVAPEPEKGMSIEDTAQDQPHEPEGTEFTPRAIAAASGAGLAYFASVGFLNAFGVMEEYYKAEILRSQSSFQISWIGSFGVFCIFAFAVPAGALSDKYGPTMPMAFGTACVFVATFLISVCKKYWQFFLVQGLLLGLGMSFVAIPVSGMVPRYFKRNRGLASGFSVAGSSLGGIVWPIVLNQLFLKGSLSFVWSMRIVALIMIALLVPVLLMVRPPRKRAGESEATGTEHGSKGKDLSAMKQPSFIFLCGGFAMCFLGFATPYFYVVDYAVDLGISQSLAFYFVAMINGGSAFGRILPGFVADRWGRVNILVCSAFATALVAFCWTAARGVAGVVVWAVAYGFVSGAILSLGLAAATSLVPSEIASTGLGITFGASSFAQLLGPPIAGQILKYGYVALSCWCGTTMLAGGALLVASRLYLDRRLWVNV